MRKHIIELIKSVIKWCIFILLVPTILLIIGFEIIISSDDVRVSPTVAIQYYKENKTLFTELATYAQKENPISVTVIKDKEEGFEIIPKIYQGVEVNIDNEEVKKDILYLFNNLKFKCFCKEENEIYFVMKSDLRFDQGIVLFTDGEIPYKKFHKLEQIHDNWYYYEVTD